MRNQKNILLLYEAARLDKHIRLTVISVFIFQTPENYTSLIKEVVSGSKITIYVNNL
jgi:hypothetical protein